MGDQRVLFVGLDAMSPSITRRLVASGRLPNLRRLMSDGRRMSVRTPYGLLVGATWPSIWSGRWPDGHGFLSYVQHVPGTYVLRRRDQLTIPTVPIWDRLAEHGRRSVIIDVPLCPPSRSPGVQHVVDWGTHDRMLPPQGFPAEMEDRLGSHPHPMPDRCDDYAQAGRYDELLAILHAGPGVKVRLAHEVLAASDWHLAMVVFGESHCAGHQFWHLHDPTHERHPGTAASPIEEVYETLDHALGPLLEVADERTTVLTLLSHGIGNHYEGEWLLGDLLARLDDQLGPPSVAVRAREKALRAASRYGRRAAGMVGHERPEERQLDGSRRWFRVPNNTLYGAVRFNIVGREPRGRLHTGEELDRARAALTQALFELRNDLTGEPVVRRVSRVADSFGTGPLANALPDLVIDWNRRAPIREVSHPVLGRFVTDLRESRTGDHREGGLLIVNGPSIAPGLDRAVDVVDLVPTIGSIVGVPLDADGRVITLEASAPA